MNLIKIIFTFLFAGFSLLSNGQKGDDVLFYVGTFSGTGAEGVYLCSFDTVTGEVRLVDNFPELDNPNFLAKSEGGKYLYVCIRPKAKDTDGYGAVAAFKINPANGKITYINEQSSEGVDPCYVDVTRDGKYVAAANYGSGTIALYKTGGDGSLGKPAQVIKHEGSGPVRGRQAGPHAHSIRFSPFSEQVFAADLGIDKLMIYGLNRDESKLANFSVPFAGIKPGSGPRHFDFHPDGKIIYLVNELNSTISVINAVETYDVVQVVRTIPEDFEGKNYCADIHVSADGKYLYCSNRGHNSISTFSINKYGQIERLGETPTNGEWPRNFTLTPGGKFMLVANQNSNNITVYGIDPKTGAPVFAGKEIKIPSPVCIVF